MAEKKTKSTPARKLSFGEAVAEVEAILAGLEREDVDLDTLGDEVRRAVELIQVCREKLAQTDSEVRGLVAGLQTDNRGGLRPEDDRGDEDLPS